MHTPVLLEEAIKALEVSEGKKYIDATFGEGGHSRRILDGGGEVLGIEWDDEKFKVQSSCLAGRQAKFKVFRNLKLVLGNFRDVEKIAKRNNFYPVDGVLFDLGLSMEQIEKSGRGFSYKKTNEPLDMRISRELDRTAADIVNSLSARQLYEIFASNSEEISSWAIAQAIVSARGLTKIETVGDLVTIIGGNESILRRIFQALRIEVNREFDNLEKGLRGAVRILKEKGRVVVITFHPLEDRIVKQFVVNNKLMSLTRKPIVAKNGKSFERSAKMRVFTTC
jgi:16S rRNA (cytosine1402-N4)-methyltransferase